MQLQIRSEGYLNYIEEINRDSSLSDGIRSMLYEALNEFEQEYQCEQGIILALKDKIPDQNPCVPNPQDQEDG